MRRFILLVEDNPSDEALTLRAVEKFQLPVRVSVARDGVEALDFIFARGPYAGREPRELPELVLLDLNLPRVNGLEVLAALRADDRTRLLPVVMLTSSIEDKDRRECYRAGCNSYVQKPMGFKDFSECVRVVTSYWLQVNQGPPHS